MPTVKDLLTELAPELGQVQSPREPWVCEHCLGPVEPRFFHCYACDQLRRAGVPAELSRNVIPISVALNPGRWYYKLATYKAGHPAYRLHLAALVWEFISHHEEAMAEMAGGPLTVVSPVPSKRGRSFIEQPLRQLIAAVRPLQERLCETLSYLPSPEVNTRRDFYPACFEPGPADVSGQRVLLIEDSWVTGATALSAAGALLRYGASAVVLMPIARVIDEKFWEGKGHPYLERLTGEKQVPFDIRRWVR